MMVARFVLYGIISIVLLIAAKLGTVPMQGHFATSMLTLVGGGMIAMAGLLFLGALGALMHAQDHQCPGVLRMHKRLLLPFGWYLSGAFMCLMAPMFFEGQAPLIALVGLIISSQSLWTFFDRLIGLIDPGKYLFALRSSIAQRATKGELTELFSELDFSFELIQRALANGTTTSALSQLRSKQNLVTEIIGAAGTYEQRHLQEPLDNFVASCCQHYETLCVNGINSRQTIPCEAALGALVAIYSAATRVKPSAGRIALGCIHRCCENLLRSSFDRVLLGLSFKDLVQEVLRLPTDAQRLPLGQIFQEFLGFLEYFVHTSVAMKEETLAKAIISSGILPLVLHGKKYVGSTFFQATVDFLTQELSKRYIREDIPFYEQLKESLARISHSKEEVLPV